MKSFNGDIWCESEVGKYTDFIMKFPKVDPSEPVLTGDEDDVVLEDEMKTWILLVDDQKVNLMVNKALMESSFRNVACDVAENGKEAVEKVKKRSYALILMDLQMPVMDGQHAVKIIRETNEIVPIVTYSSLYQLHAKHQVLEHGFDDCLSKPISNDLLLRTVAKWTLAEYAKSYDFSKVAPDVDLENKNILLVDDQDINRMLSAKYLKERKANIDEARNGVEAVEKFRQNYDKYDVILMDIQMPVMDGNQAIAEIRKIQIEKNMTSIPAIALSGDGGEESIRHFLKSGFNDYFVKGGDYENLVNLMKFWMKEEPKGGMVLNAEPKKIISDKLSKQVLIEFGAVFEKEASELIAEIKQDKIKADLVKFLFHCHALKGICGNIGADKMFEYVSYLNDIAKIEKWPEEAGWEGKLEEFMKEFEGEFKKLKNGV
jgi:CheY-like chemotaxis protein